MEHEMYYSWPMEHAKAMKLNGTGDAKNNEMNIG